MRRRQRKTELQWGKRGLGWAGEPRKAGEGHRGHVRNNKCDAKKPSSKSVSLHRRGKLKTL